MLVLSKFEVVSTLHIPLAFDNFFQKIVFILGPLLADTRVVRVIDSGGGGSGNVDLN